MRPASDGEDPHHRNLQGDDGAGDQANRDIEDGAERWAEVPGGELIEPMLGFYLARCCPLGVDIGDK